MRTFGLFLGILACMSAQACADAPFDVKGTLTGAAEVVDGDGISVRGTEVRLQGLAAPEDRRGRVDPGGKAATAALKAMVEGREVTCYLDGTTTRGRPVGICALRGVDVAEAMVEGGFARDCPRFSKGRYAPLERVARANGNDLSRIYPLPGYCIERTSRIGTPTQAPVPVLWNSIVQQIQAGNRVINAAC